MAPMDTEFAAILREQGIRMTGPRRLVWETLRHADSHLTADEITSRVNAADPAVNVSSIYRSLALFSDMGLVRESNLGTDGAARWELAHPDEHFHLVCRSCGQVDHHVGQLVEEIREHLSGGHGFVAEGIDLVVTGLCAACTANGSSK